MFWQENQRTHVCSFMHMIYVHDKQEIKSSVTFALSTYATRSTVTQQTQNMDRYPNKIDTFVTQLSTFNY